MILLLAISALLPLSCKKDASFLRKEKVVAKVDGTEITQRDLVKYYRSIIQPSVKNEKIDTEVSLALKRSLLERLIEDKLFLREAAKEGIKVSNDEVNQLYEGVAEDYGSDFKGFIKKLNVKPEEWKASLHRDLLIEKVIARHLQSLEDITNDEIKEYYQSHMKEFQMPMQYRISQIVVPTLKTARQIRKKLMGGEGFSELSKRYSIFPEGKQGGDLGYLREDHLPEEFMIVQQMKVGEISKIFHTPYGYHIITLTGVRDARVLSLREAGPQISRILLQEKRERERVRWLKELKKKAHIVRYEDELKKMTFN